MTLTKKRMLSPETMEEFTASKSSSPPVSSLASQPSSVSHLRYPANETGRGQRGRGLRWGAETPGCGCTHRSWLPRQHPAPCEGLLLHPGQARAPSYKRSARTCFGLASGSLTLEPSQGTPWTSHAGPLGKRMVRAARSGVTALLLLDRQNRMETRTASDGCTISDPAAGAAPQPQPTLTPRCSSAQATSRTVISLVIQQFETERREGGEKKKRKKVSKETPDMDRQTHSSPQGKGAGHGRRQHRERETSLITADNSSQR